MPDPATMPQSSWIPVYCLFITKGLSAGTIASSRLQAAVPTEPMNAAVHFAVSGAGVIADNSNCAEPFVMPLPFMSQIAVQMPGAAPWGPMHDAAAAGKSAALVHV